ncbi:MAG: ABC transporter ATP-binding protein [Nitriliruptoraceae bacterium]|nr:ABC transporter ATP-binding protein [Nitriliruptoraceae bacterium]
MPSVIVDRVDITYRIYADSAPKLRKAFVRDRKQREYRSVEAVRDVSFVARRGEAIGIIGHNGSGKSTLLRGIAGLVPISEGDVYASSIPVLLGVGAALEPDLSGRRNILLGGTALGVPRAELLDRIDEIIEFAGVEEFIDLPLRAFSSGMRSRLQFAIATSSTPEILMVDEALSTGDAEFKERSDARIKEMLGEAGTVFLVSHSMKSIRDVCTRVLWLDHGRLVADGETDALVDAYEEHVGKGKKRKRRDREEQPPERDAP